MLAEALALIEAVGVDVGPGRGDRHVLDAALGEPRPGSLDQPLADALTAPLSQHRERLQLGDPLAGPP